MMPAEIRTIKQAQQTEKIIMDITIMGDIDLFIQLTQLPIKLYLLDGNIKIEVNLQISWINLFLNFLKLSRIQNHLLKKWNDTTAESVNQMLNNPIFRYLNGNSALVFYIGSLRLSGQIRSGIQ